MRRERSSAGRAAVLTAALVLGGCAGGAGNGVDARALEASTRAGDAPLVLDVRSRGEFESGHLPGARHLPFESTWTRRESLPASLDAPIVVYCEHGPRAALARFGLESLGYRNVRSLAGHMAGWRAAGLPVVDGAR